jgi:predicted HAD superfamily Cof-like phosphohydrolase
MSLSCFKKVGEFHDVFGHPVLTTPQKNILHELPKMVPFRFKLIKEEIDELKDAIKKHDFIECIDAICDMMYFIYGTYHVMGIDFDALPQQPYAIYDKDTNNFKIFNDDVAVLNSVLKDIDLNVNVVDQIVASVSSTYTTEMYERCFYKVIHTLDTLEALAHTLASLFGVDIYACFAEVHRSNMTKLCKTEEEAKLTVDKYNSDPENRYEPAYRQYGGYWVMYNKKDSKIIKSMNWELPDLKKVLGL